MVKQILIIMLSVLTCLSGGCKTTPEKMDVHINGDLNSQLGIERIWIEDTYYSAGHIDDQYVIFANKEGEKEPFVYTTTLASDLNLVDQQTMMYRDGNKICLCDLITSNVREIVVANNPINLLVREGNAYYSENGSIFMLDISTGNQQKIADNTNTVHAGFSVYNGYVFYQTILYDDERIRPVIMKKNIYNLSEEEIVFEGPATYIVAREEGVYFLNFNLIIPANTGEGVLCRINPDGTLVRLGEQRVFSYNIQGEWIYYANDSDGRKLYQMRTDGTENKKIFEKPVFFIGAYGNELEFTSVDDNGILCAYKMNLNNFRSELIETFLP